MVMPCHRPGHLHGTGRGAWDYIHVHTLHACMARPRSWSRRRRAKVHVTTRPRFAEASATGREAFLLLLRQDSLFYNDLVLGKIGIQSLQGLFANQKRLWPVHYLKQS